MTKHQNAPRHAKAWPWHPFPQPKNRASSSATLTPLFWF